MDSTISSLLCLSPIHTGQRLASYGFQRQTPSRKEARYEASKNMFNSKDTICILPTSDFREVVNLPNVVIRFSLLSFQNGNIVDNVQGFRKFCKVADIFLKAPEVTLFSAGRRLASAEGASYL